MLERQSYLLEKGALTFDEADAFIITDDESEQFNPGEFSLE
jgi:hypothetical protein